jgi:hypothetical protein
MSRSTDRERARLNAATRHVSTNTRDGLTTGSHGEHIITADSDEAYAVKAGILGAGAVGGGIAAGLTYGTPAQQAEQRARDQERTVLGNEILSREQRDATELALRRENDLLEAASEAINGAAIMGFGDASSNVEAASILRTLSNEQIGRLVASGEVDEADMDHLLQQVAPAVIVAEQDVNTAQTRAAGAMQKGLALVRLQEERGLDDASFAAHRDAVVAYASAHGVRLADESMGSVQFADLFFATEVRMAEEARADANARFQADVLNASGADITRGLEVLGDNGWKSAAPGGEILPKPDFEKAAQRVLGGLDGHPMHDSADDIRSGIVNATSPTESNEWTRVQESAGALFSAQEEARIAAKLGER